MMGIRSLYGCKLILMPGFFDCAFRALGFIACNRGAVLESEK